MDLADTGPTDDLDRDRVHAALPDDSGPGLGVPESDQE
jgi:hypothetical protein